MRSPAFVQVRDAVRLLGVALASHALYGPRHTRTATAAANFASAARATGGFRILLVGPNLSWDGIPLRGNTVFDRLARTVRERSLAGIEVDARARGRDVLDLHDVLVGRADASRPDATVRALVQWSLDRSGPHAEIAERHPEFGLALALYDEVARCLDSTMGSAMAGRIDVEEVNQVAARVCDAIAEGGIDMLGPVHLVQANTYTWQHSVNVFLLSLNVIQHLTEDRTTLLECAQAALLHDIGKSRVPAWILNKPTGLNEDELRARIREADVLVVRSGTKVTRRLLEEHVEHGAEILGAHDDVLPLACEVAYCHHMRDDGLGYPAPHPSIRPGPVTDVVQVADMLEALLAWRPYKDPLTLEHSLHTLRSTRGMASKEPVIAMLVRSLSPYPTGARVTLKNESAGIVLDPGPPVRLRIEGPDREVLEIDPELIARVQPRALPALAETARDDASVSSSA